MTRVITPRICPRLGPVSMSSGWIVVVASEVDSSSSPTSRLRGVLKNKSMFVMAPGVPCTQSDEWQEETREAPGAINVGDRQGRLRPGALEGWVFWHLPRELHLPCWPSHVPVSRPPCLSSSFTCWCHQFGAAWLLLLVPHTPAGV